MFQLIFIGNIRDARIWQRRTAIHAARLGLHSNGIQWDIKPERRVLFVSMHYDSALNEALSPKVNSYNNGVVLKEENYRWRLNYFENQEDYYKAIECRHMADMWVVISQDGNHVYLWCGFIAIDQLYHRREADGILISNDLRLLVHGDTNDLDPAGFYSLFHFGAVSAPFTIFKNVKRVPAGHLLKFSSPDFVEELIPQPLENFRVRSPVSLQSETTLEKTLITKIDKIPEGSGVFFSGGVDSGLLAALAKRQGRFDLRLINCDFSASLKAGNIDLEATLARDMAAHLGHKLFAYSFDLSLVPKMLERIGDDYTFPFSDYSTIAVNQLVQYTKNILEPGCWVVDATGADGIFLNGSSLKRMHILYKIPRIMRESIAFLYQYERIFSSGRLLSEWIGIINESLKIPIMQLLVIAKSHLSGSGFIEKSEILDKVLQTQRNHIETLLSPFDDRMRLSLLDILWVCIGIYAAKGFNPLRSFGLQPFFPFLSEKAIIVGAAIMKDQRELRENKRILKALLLRDVPYEMVYRPKSGFKPPLTLILRNPKVKEYIKDIVLTNNNPINEFVYYPIVRKLLTRIWNGERMSRYHLNFLWSYIFGSIWLKRQFESSCRF